MVIYSGGNYLGTGILCGRADRQHPTVIGRGMRRQGRDYRADARHQIFVDETRIAEMAMYRRKAQQVVDALAEVDGLRVSLEHDEHNYLIPHAVMRFTRDWRGPGRNEVYQSMIAGDPPIYLHDIFDPDELAVDPSTWSLKSSSGS